MDAHERLIVSSQSTSDWATRARSDAESHMSPAIIRVFFECPTTLNADETFLRKCCGRVFIFFYAPDRISPRGTATPRRAHGAKRAVAHCAFSRQQLKSFATLHALALALTTHQPPPSSTMKFAVIAAFAAFAVSSTCHAADVNVVGANNLRTAMDKTTGAMDDVKIDVMVMGGQTDQSTEKDVDIATQSSLNDSTGLVNKNMLAKDNNIFISRSNIIFTQDDRMTMRQKVRDALKRKSDKGEQDMDAATLTKNVLRAVSANDKDSVMMAKASAVIAAKNMDDATLSQRIADFVDAAGKREMDREEEQAIQSQVPRGVTVLVGTKDILRQPTSVVNKDIAPSDNQIVITRSNVQPSQNDNIVLSGQSKVADAVLPASVVNVADRQDDQPMFRVRVVYRKQQDKQDADKKQEQFGLWGAGWGLGWRYPLGYWNTVGFGLYGGGCGLGFPMGGFYYC